MQAMSISQSCPSSRSQLTWVFFIYCFLVRLCSSLELETPPRLIITHEPTDIGYKIEADGTDITRWLMNITDLDGRNPETLNDGEAYEVSSAQGFLEVIIEREGLFLLKAVNPEIPSQVFATSLPAIVVDTPPSGGSGSPGDDDDDDDDDGGEDPGDEDDDDGHTGTGPVHESSTTRESAQVSSTPVKPTRSPSATGRPLGAKNGNGNAGLIAGVITASIIALVLVILALFWMNRGRKPKKPSRPLTFYRDRMIRAPTPPPEITAPAKEIRQLPQRPVSFLNNGDTSYHSYNGSVGSGAAAAGAGAGAYGMYHPGPGSVNAFPYRTPNSASATGVNVAGLGATASPRTREFILRSPRPLPPSPGGGAGGLREFILKSPLRDSFAGYSKP